MKGIKAIALTLSLLFVILCSGSAFADEQRGCLKLKESERDFDAVAKGQTITLRLRFNTHDCHLPVDSFPTVSLNADTPTGLHVTTGTPYSEKINRSEENPGLRTSDEMWLRVFVTVPDEAAPGKYEVATVLNYEAINEKGDRVQESTPVTISVKVVASQADVHPIEKHDPWKPLKETGKVAGMIAVGIVAVPVLLVVEGVGFLITGRSILPDC